MPGHLICRTSHFFFFLLLRMYEGAASVFEEAVDTQYKISNRKLLIYVHYITIYLKHKCMNPTAEILAHVEVTSFIQVRQYVLCVVGSRRLMPPDALQPKAYCTNPGL